MSEYSNNRQVLEQRLKEKEASLSKRFEELAQLTRMLEEERAEREALQQALDELRQQPGSTTPVSEPISELESEPAPEVEAPSKELTAADRNRSLAHRDMVRQSDLFDGEWYLAMYPDVGIVERYLHDPQDHYLLFGGFEGRNPCPEFDAVYYLNQYPDVTRAKVTPLVHYLLFGRDEGRRMAPPVDEV
ncbi:MAG: hypothetical protein L0J54_10115 [Halomonas sp.]|nr:hypothetical protein [Halomonas sp.]MDN6298360.1 hypothetical protein [Halomonas sp.]MDN6315594.1 hypothetical protein [Halomonas sp.]MDN6336765.1 hypothetical protein [Halomonas sp.]